MTGEEILVGLIATWFLWILSWILAFYRFKKRQWFRAFFLAGFGMTQLVSLIGFVFNLMR